MKPPLHSAGPTVGLPRRRPASRLSPLLLACALLAGYAGAQQVPEHAPDGGAVLRIQSIDIPPVPNSPFSANVVTELTTIMPDGSKRTIWNHRVVARDSAGRVFQERRAFTPNGRTEATRIVELDYVDSNQHQRLVCSPNLTCRQFSEGDYTLPSASSALPAASTLPDGTTITRENLGSNVIEGVDVVGSREVTMMPASVIGAQKPQPMVKEFWYSERLGINLVTKRFDPRLASIQNFNVTEINLSEPDPKLFALPAGYRVIPMDEAR